MTFSSDLALNTNQLPISLDVNAGEENYDEILQLYLRRVANAVNSKESGLFLLQENAAFEQWFNEVVENSSTQQYLRNAYRLTVDLVALNLAINSAATIATQAANSPLSLQLTTSTIPVAVSGYLYPVQGFGGALDNTGISYFLNDPAVYVRYVSATNTFLVYNTSGNSLTWAVYVIEFLKN
jgi:hypothetical protein